MERRGLKWVSESQPGAQVKKMVPWFGMVVQMGGGR